ncbi:Response regulator receiver domain [Desulfosarcina cetonica]|uniref:response regulator n=1 Tax=Desulfosarcina cetonica TaxID=90730 RepID=UPI00155DB2B2|nr:response regulator [Desulfosarcina cetonica]VTR64295.1 Response regulator receiver domain [Desulfosarcina cetonica]
MITVLLVTPDRNHLADLSTAIGSQGGAIDWKETGDQALETLRAQAADLVVVDETLPDMTGLEFIERLVAINPMINCALVSSLSKADYHEASEGLGVLMQLPPRPSQADAKRLITHLNQILGFATAGNG